MRIPLRRFRFLSREPYVELDGPSLRLRLPGIFGGRQEWDLDIADVAVVNPKSVNNDDSGDDWAFERRVSIPYAVTTDPRVAPNVVLLFKTPQRVPPLRFGGADRIGLPYLKSRSETGVHVDGVRLRAEDPVGASDALVAAGAERVDRPLAWLRRHRPVTQDPALVQVDQARRRDLRRVVWLIIGAGYLVPFVVIATDLPTWGIMVVLGVPLLVVIGLSVLARRRAERPLGARHDA